MKSRFSMLISLVSVLLVMCSTLPFPAVSSPSAPPGDTLTSSQAPAQVSPGAGAADPDPERSTALTVWVESVANKVQPTTAPGAGSAIQLEGTRNSYEAAQIVVTASSGALTGVDITAGKLSDGAGHSLPAANITFFRQDFIDFTGVVVAEHGNLEVPENSPTGDGRLPDPLIPFNDPYTGSPAGAPFAVAVGLNQPVWVDVFISTDTVAGTYQGGITVTADSEAPISIPVTLTVWDIVLPDMDEVVTYFGMYTNDFIQFHSGTWDCYGDDCWLDWNERARIIVKRYEQLAHEHRTGAWPNFIPDTGDGCAPPSDWSAYDAALQPYLNGTYWDDGVPSSWIRMPFSPGVDWGFEGSCTQSDYTALAAAWAAHLKAQGWFDEALVYAYDEPPDDVLDEIALHSGWMQDGDPDWKARIMDTTAPSPGNVGTLNPALGIYCVCLRCYDAWAADGGTPSADIPYGRAEWPGLFDLDIELWFYESNAQGAPYPTFATNTLLGFEPHIMMWGAWYEEASGFLLWDMTAWDTGDSWGPNVSYGKTGDGVLIYPGNYDGRLAPLGSPPDVAIDGPIPSYRLKMVRAALQDWALFRLAERYGLGAYARGQVTQVYSQLGGCEWQGCPPPVNGEFFWQADDALMQQIRRNIAQAILNAPPLQMVYLPVISND